MKVRSHDLSMPRDPATANAAIELLENIECGTAITPVEFKDGDGEVRINSEAIAMYRSLAGQFYNATFLSGSGNPMLATIEVHLPGVAKPITLSKIPVIFLRGSAA